MTDIYNICFYGGLVLAILLLITSVVLFVVLKIPRVIGELSGRTARKGIEELKGGAKETSAVSKKEQAKYYNQNSGKIKIREAVSTEPRKKNSDDTTDLPGKRKETESGKTADLSGKRKETESDRPTDVLERKKADTGDEVTDLLREEATDVLQGEEATAVLQGEEATEVLRDDEITDILRDDETTDILRDEDQTSVLTEKGVTDKLVSRVKVLYNVVVVNTDEKL